MTVDLRLTNGKIVTDSGMISADVSIDGSVIVCVGKGSGIHASERTIDCEGKIILPGLIDAHVHFRDPGFTHKEDFLTGSTAAVFGGVTTVMDMPNTDPPVNTVRALEEKKAIASRKSLVDFSLIASIRPDFALEATNMVRAGASHFKIVTGGYSTKERPDVQGLVVTDTGRQYAIFKAAKVAGKVLAIHAEDEELRTHFAALLRAEGKRDHSARFLGRPSSVEAHAIAGAISLARLTGCRIHISHITSIEGVGLVRVAKNEGIQITCEACPHHLLLTWDDVEKLGSNAIMGPPLKTEIDRRALWKGIQDGTIDTIASDHAPHTAEEKQVGWKDIWRTPAGVIGVETLLPLMLDAVDKGLINLQKLVELTSYNPAKIFGKFPRKGSFRTGSDADLVVVDPKHEWVIEPEKLHSKSKNTPFSGWRVKGKAVLTIIRGQVVQGGEEIVQKPGYGKLLP